jgi:hypothetical protein
MDNQEIKTEIDHKITFVPNDIGLNDCVTVGIALKRLGLTLDDFVKLQGICDIKVTHINWSGHYITSAELDIMVQRHNRINGGVKW